MRVLLKRQEEELLKNELKFKTVFDQSTVGFAFVDAHSGDFMEVNNKYCAILGYAPEDIKGKNFASFTHPDDIADWLANLKNLEEGTIKEYSTEKRYISKSGDIIWVNMTVSPLWESNEKPTINIAFIKDITEKKTAYSLIEKSEKRFRSFFDNSPLPMWEENFSEVKKHLVELGLMNKNPETVISYFNENPQEIYKCISLVKIIDVNNECLKLHKVKSKEILLESLDKLIDSSSIDAVINQLVAITQNAKKFSIDSRIKNMDGNYRDIHLQWSVTDGYEDSYERVILSTQDITNRKATERAIHYSQLRTESIINTIDGVVWEYDPETSLCIFISEKVKRILGYTVKEWKSSPTFWEDHIHPDDLEFVLELTATATKQHSNIDYEYRIIAKNGEIKWIRDIVSFVFENNKMTSRGLMIDITIMKEAERDLNNSFNLVTEQNKRLLNFSYIVSHNLRSHTSNIESIITLIETAESEEERNQMMQLLKSVSNSLDETMSHLNEVVNINTNLSLVVKPLNLKQYISTTKNTLSEQIFITNATINTNVPDDVMVNYNPAYLESILYNLTSNAIRYKQPGITPIISINWHKENALDVLEISDNGIGIDLNKNGDKMFGMYKTFSNNKDSRGIGLYITKNQVEAMGGTITVESELNKGTTFKIYIK